MSSYRDDNNSEMPLEDRPPGLFTGSSDDFEVFMLLADNDSTLLKDGAIFDDVLLEVSQTPTTYFEPNEDPTYNPYRDSFLAAEEAEFDDVTDDTVTDNTEDDSSLENPPDYWQAGLAAGAGAAVLAGAGVMLARRMSSSRENNQSQQEWYYFANGQQAGPLEQSAVQQLINDGKLTGEVYVWREGLTDWLPMAQAGFSPQVSQQPTITRVTQPVNEPVQKPEWYYCANGQTTGPVSEGEIKAMAQNGQVASDTYVWRQGMHDWTTAQAAGLVAAVKRDANYAQKQQICSGCGKSVNASSLFCGHCGRKAAQSTGSIQESICPKCKAAMKQDAKFCGKCGYRL